MKGGQPQGMPIILILYRNPWRYSQYIFIAVTGPHTGFFLGHPIDCYTNQKHQETVLDVLVTLLVA